MPGNTVYWNIAGGLFYPELFNLAHLLNLMNRVASEQKVQMFVYDSHQGMSWNGGRVIHRCNSSTKEDALQIVHKWNALGIGFYFVFSNHLIENRHLGDARCNYFLEHAHNPMNGVVCSSDVLCDYVKEKFPQYTVKCSVMKPYLEGKNSWKDLDYHRNLLGRYDIVVLSPRMNLDFDFISQLPTDRIELLVNEVCLKDCAFTKKHYQALNFANMTGDWDAIEATYFFCGKQHGGGRQLPNPPQMELNLDHIRALQSLGVSRFKLQGRTDSFNSGLRQSIQKFIVNPHLPEGVNLIY
ncbi:MAG: hypothetical protein HQL84_08600 [Magnetococcales bacterium]|nr:hypothetical protein [Magnetococcales bacterium]MBF0150089.1 hypothetical protein [Magnetococcales bacterium]